MSVQYLIVQDGDSGEQAAAVHNPIVHSQQELFAHQVQLEQLLQALNKVPPQMPSSMIDLQVIREASTGYIIHPVGPISQLPGATNASAPASVAPASTATSPIIFAVPNSAGGFTIMQQAPRQPHPLLQPTPTSSVTLAAPTSVNQVQNNNTQPTRASPTFTCPMTPMTREPALPNNRHPGQPTRGGRGGWRGGARRPATVATQAPPPPLAALPLKPSGSISWAALARHPSAAATSPGNLPMPQKPVDLPLPPAISTAAGIPTLGSQLLAPPSVAIQAISTAQFQEDLQQHHIARHFITAAGQNEATAAALGFHQLPTPAPVLRMADEALFAARPTFPALQHSRLINETTTTADPATSIATLPSNPFLFKERSVSVEVIGESKTPRVSKTEVDPLVAPQKLLASVLSPDLIILPHKFDKDKKDSASVSSHEEAPRVLEATASLSTNGSPSAVAVVDVVGVPEPALNVADNNLKTSVWLSTDRATNNDSVIATDKTDAENNGCNEKHEIVSSTESSRSARKRIGRSPNARDDNKQVSPPKRKTNDENSSEESEASRPVRKKRICDPAKNRLREHTAAEELLTKTLVYHDGFLYEGQKRSASTATDGKEITLVVSPSRLYCIERNRVDCQAEATLNERGEITVTSTHCNHESDIQACAMVMSRRLHYQRTRKEYYGAKKETHELIIGHPVRGQSVELPVDATDFSVHIDNDPETEPPTD